MNFLLSTIKPNNEKTREEKIKSEKDSSYGVTTLESFDFEDVWNFNHPHLNVEDR
jgi:hypothetical protein